MVFGHGEIPKQMATSFLPLPLCALRPSSGKEQDWQSLVPQSGETSASCMSTYFVFRWWYDLVLTFVCLHQRGSVQCSLLVCLFAALQKNFWSGFPETRWKCVAWPKEVPIKCRSRSESCDHEVCTCRFADHRPVDYWPWRRTALSECIFSLVFIVRRRSL